MIFTLTLNPALDKTIKVKEFKKGQLNRIQDVRVDIGGKGINVSQVINKLAGESIALGFVGGRNGEFLSDSLKQLGIKEEFIWLEGETRSNIKLIEDKNDEITELNETGIPVSKEKLSILTEKLLSLLSKGDYVVLAGSLPPSVPKRFYADLTEKIKKIGAKVVLDTSGQALVKGLEGKPNIIKPNLAEINDLFNQDLKEVKEIAHFAEKIQKNGVEIVIVSLGSRGALAINSEDRFYLKAPTVKAKSTVGAGDTLVGALVYQLNQDKSLQSALKYAVAASTNSVTKPGTSLCEKKEVEQLLARIELERLN